MVFKLMEFAQKRWIKIRGFNPLTLVVNNVKFEDGVPVVEQLDKRVA
jgi:putative transposase